MKPRRSSRSSRFVPLPVLAISITIALAAPGIFAPPARASAEDSAEVKPAPASPKAPDAPQVNVIEDGILRNTAHGLRFPVPAGFDLRASSTADEIVLTAANCEDCVLRVLVSPGNTDSLETTARALKKQVASEPTAHVLDEQNTRVARQRAYTLVKEETPEAGPRILTRYVTFNRGEDKYYFVLREPQARFSDDEDAFERLLSKLRFEP
jgi:hypothetical protein